MPEDQSTIMSPHSKVSVLRDVSSWRYDSDARHVTQTNREDDAVSKRE